MSAVVLTPLVAAATPATANLNGKTLDESGGSGQELQDSCINACTPAVAVATPSAAATSGKTVVTRLGLPGVPEFARQRARALLGIIRIPGSVQRAAECAVIDPAAPRSDLHRRPREGGILHDCLWTHGHGRRDSCLPKLGLRVLIARPFCFLALPPAWLSATAQGGCENSTVGTGHIFLTVVYSGQESVVHDAGTHI